jgi:hypothetical protein
MRVDWRNRLTSEARSGTNENTSNAIRNAIGYAKHYSRSHDAMIRVYDKAGNVIETHESWRPV